jgi:hypothetical protein
MMYLWQYSCPLYSLFNPGKARTLMASCRTNLLGIQLVYCDETGTQQTVWLDLKKVQALSWCSGEVKAKGNNAGGTSKLPRDPKGPGKCPPDHLVPSDPLCWWDGNQWICGIE